jgi:hypothetical protein
MNKIKYPTLKLGVLFATLLLLPTHVIFAAAKSQSSNNDFSLSIGNLCEYIGKYQTNENGSKNACSFLPSVAGNFDYYFTPGLILSPQLGATLPKSGRDENIKRMTFFGLLNAKYKTEYVNFILGTGFYFTRIWGPGGEEALNNGNSSDSFPLPAEAVYSRNFIVNLGLGHDFNREWSGELYTYIFNAESSSARAFSAGANVTYHFGEFL